MTPMPEMELVRRIEVRRGGDEPSLWAIVDEADYELISRYRWWASESLHTVYALTRPGTGTLYMHRLILEVPSGMEVDHINRNALDNRRSNLRLATRVENMRNRRGQDTRAGRPTTSRFKGVSRDSRSRAWEVRIQVDGRREFLGYYANEEEAARVYDRRAREAFGEFACLNFPDETAA